MKRYLAAKTLLVSGLLLAGTQAALADACKERFIELMTDRTAKEPTKIFITQEIKGGAKTVNWNYQDGKATG